MTSVYCLPLSLPCTPVAGMSGSSLIPLPQLGPSSSWREGRTEGKGDRSEAGGGRRDEAGVVSMLKEAGPAGDMFSDLQLRLR